MKVSTGANIKELSDRLDEHFATLPQNGASEAAIDNTILIVRGFGCVTRDVALETVTKGLRRRHLEASAESRLRLWSGRGLTLWHRSSRSGDPNRPSRRSRA